ncbi:MAG: TetR/AcrR family transcriptional regulator [Hymenobacteraceae bacterium]|nr:TetR/AcrR family transcriptional regulator [Hymenobacteraceae bacterium]MDX5394944.1 TetR/AcrR family transcriptional regulator [Hymenobacteraceae bacterium]MDX5510978.1 TetR/AcrR family transcriptional regulator [Hymenobacteraceae bacterium]
MNISISINHKSYLRDPESSELGKKIISESIKLMDELGFEQFTFKKLAAEIGSTEASVYRYFENKHKLLVYLVSWYWAWLDFHVTYQTHNLQNPQERLNRVIDVIAAPRTDDPGTPHINESVLHRIVMAEASKVYLTKEVDAENQEGYFMEYKKLCHHIAEMMLEINPNYAYPHTLTSTMLEMAHRQVFFAQHLPSLTEITGSRTSEAEAGKFLKQLVFSAINTNQNGPKQ